MDYLRVPSIIPIAVQAVFPSMIQIDPVLKALNANGDKEITKDEIDGSAAALKTLDKNNDGKISEDEIRPQFWQSKWR